MACAVSGMDTGFPTMTCPSTGLGGLGGGFGGDLTGFGGLGGGFGGGFGGDLGFGNLLGGRRGGLFDPDFALDTFGLGTYDPLDEMRRSFRQRRRGGEQFADVDWIPATDIADAPDNKILIALALPGVRKEDVNVELRPWPQGPHDHLVVQGKRDDPEVERWRRAEIPSGRFRRTFKVHKGLKDNEITPKMENGMLYLSYPRVQPQQQQPEGKRIQL